VRSSAGTTALFSNISPKRFLLFSSELAQCRNCVEQ
jgi:hypothetical protein